MGQKIRIRSGRRSGPPLPRPGAETRSADL